MPSVVTAPFLLGEVARSDVIDKVNVVRSTDPPGQTDLAHTLQAVISVTDEVTGSQLASGYLQRPLIAFAGGCHDIYNVMNSVKRSSQDAAVVVVLMALCETINQALSSGRSIESHAALALNAALHALDGVGPHLYDRVGPACAPAPDRYEAVQLSERAWKFLEDRVEEKRAEASEDVVVDALEVLGLEPGATDDEVRRAFRTLALRWHPDRQAHSSPDGRATATERMAALNDAFSVLRSRGTTVSPSSGRQHRDARTRHSTGSGYGAGREADRGATNGTSRTKSGHGGATRTDPGRGPTAEECQWCAHSPAGSFSFKKVTGMILVRRTEEVAQTLCRSCALAVGADVQNRTLMTGWWGPIAAITNVFAIIGNAVSLVKARRLKLPRPPSGRVHRPSATPMPAPPSFFVRSGTLFVAAAIAVVAVVGSAGSVPTSTSSGNSGGGDRSSPTSDANNDLSDLVGECLLLDSSGAPVDVVSCSAPHDVEVVDVVMSTVGCPSWSDWYIEADPQEVGPRNVVCLVE